MSEELTDVRSKVSRRTDKALSAFSRARGLEKSELIREVLTKYADEQIHGAMVVQRLLRDEGVLGELEGLTGESQGLAGESQGMSGRR